MSTANSASSGTPDELLAHPTDAFVASFTGANLLPGRVLRRHAHLTEVALESGEMVRSSDDVDGDVAVVVHPWDITLTPNELSPDPARNEIREQITSVMKLGGRVRIRLGSLTAELPAASVDHQVLAVGATVCASFTPDHTTLIRR